MVPKKLASSSPRMTPADALATVSRQLGIGRSAWHLGTTAGHQLVKQERFGHVPSDGRPARPGGADGLNDVLLLLLRPGYTFS